VVTVEDTGTVILVAALIRLRTFVPGHYSLPAAPITEQRIPAVVAAVGHRLPDLNRDAIAGG